jgi:hypothetical protein
MILTSSLPQSIIKGGPQLQIIKSKCIIEELSQRTVANNTSEYKSKNNKTLRIAYPNGHERPFEKSEKMVLGSEDFAENVIRTYNRKTISNKFV